MKSKIDYIKSLVEILQNANVEEYRDGSLQIRIRPKTVEVKDEKEEKENIEFWSSE